MPIVLGSRPCLALATAALLAWTPQARAARADVAAVVGSWRLEDSTPDPELFRDVPGPYDAVDTSNDRPLAMYLAVEQNEAQAEQTYLNEVAPHLFSRDNYLAIGLIPLDVTVTGSLEAVDYPANRQPFKAVIAGVSVKVSTERRPTSLVQEITGDHSLKIERTLQPSDDGSELRISLSVLSPKVTPPLVVTRVYRRLAATPFAGRIPVLPNGPIRATASPAGGTVITEEASLTLRADGRRTEVLLVGRPTSPVNVAFESLDTGAGAPVDLTQPGPLVEEIVPGGAREPVGSTIAVAPPVAPAPASQTLHGPGRSLVVTWSAPDGRHSCLLPVAFQAATVDEAGAVVFNGVRAALADGSQDCTSVEHGFKARMTYTIAPGASGRH
jgi:hypothetical protein